MEKREEPLWPSFEYFFISSLFCADEEEENLATLSADELLKAVAVLAARAPRARTPLPAGLRTDHSLVDLPPAHDDEAAIEVSRPTYRATVVHCILVIRIQREKHAMSFIIFLW